MGPVIAGVLLGAHLQWWWIGGLVTGLIIVAIAALRLHLPDRSGSASRD
jgi:predicted MFS family arabinose efflux permease